MIRVLIADDQALVRSGFEMILSTEEGITVVATAGNGARAVELARELRPEVCLLDVQMPVMDGIAATRRIVGEGLSRVVILTTFDRDDYLFEALEAGASGFLLKNSEPERLVDAIHVVAEGQALLSPDVTTRVIARMAHEGRPGARGAQPSLTTPALALPPGVELTAREREVLRLVAEGLSNAEIGSRLFVGEATVKTHVSNILAKLGVRDRVQAVVWAYRAGVVSPQT